MRGRVVLGLACAALIVGGAALATVAWVDGGREPVRDLVQHVAIPEQAR